MNGKFRRMFASRFSSKKNTKRKHFFCGGKETNMIIHTDEPLVTEATTNEIRNVEKTQQHFVRNHGLVNEEYKNVNKDTYIVNICGKNVTLGLLKEKYKSETFKATIVCAGNRRSEMINDENKGNMTMFGNGAISSAVYRGTKISDILIDTITLEGKHVEFTGNDYIHKYDESYKTSIPIELINNVYLVYEMNGKPLPYDHGYPVRIICQSLIGARSCKWLKSIRILDEPSQSKVQQKEYKINGIDLYEPPCNSIILKIQQFDNMNMMKVTGYYYVNKTYENSVKGNKKNEESLQLIINNDKSTKKDMIINSQQISSKTGKHMFTFNHYWSKEKQKGKILDKIWKIGCRLTNLQPSDIQYNEGGYFTNHVQYVNV